MIFTYIKFINNIATRMNMLTEIILETEITSLITKVTEKV